MKKVIFSFFAVLLITGCTPPKEEIDVAKEEEAIIATIKKEIAAFWEQDYIAEANFWVKEDYLTIVRNNDNTHHQTHGWDSVFASIKRTAENENWQYVSNVNTEFKDFNIKVYDKFAWAVFYVSSTWDYKGEPYVGDNDQVRAIFLEKRDDKWVMALNAMTRLNPCEDEDEEGDEDD